MSETDVGEIVARVRRDAYTGSNRCWPCTVLNVGLLVVVAFAVGVFLSPFASGLVVSVGVCAVWLRGYLVPYTPRLTFHLMGILPGDSATHRVAPEPAERDAGSRTGGGDDTEIVDGLLAAGVLVANGDELSLAPAFRDAWRAEIESNRPYDAATLAVAMEDTIPWVADATVVTDDGRDWIRLTDEGDNIANETWMALPAAVADLTAVRTLDAWTSLPVVERTLAAPPLRQFLERCPVCDERLEVNSPTACCGSPRYVAEGIEAVLNCPECDEIVTVFEVDEGPN